MNINDIWYAQNNVDEKVTMNQCLWTIILSNAAEKISVFKIQNAFLTNTPKLQNLWTNIIGEILKWTWSQTRLQEKFYNHPTLKNLIPSLPLPTLNCSCHYISPVFGVYNKMGKIHH